MTARQPRRVLVTGGAGYIGAHVVRRLREGGDTPVVLDDLSSGTRDAVGAAVIHVGDAGDPELVVRILRDERVEAVIHLAGRKSVEESVRDPALYVRANVVGTLALLEACQAAGVNRFVFSSSAAVYGTPERLPVREDDATHPENPYGETKLAVERLLHWFGRAHGLRSVSLRYFNAAGAASDGSIGESWEHATNLIPIVLRAAWHGTAVHIFGSDYPTPDGTPVRDYIHVTDLADAHARAIDHLERAPGTTVINLGTGSGVSVREVIDAARGATGRTIDARAAARRPGDPAAVWADNSRARELLGWEPRYGLTEMLETAWAWHVAHPTGNPVAK